MQKRFGRIQKKREQHEKGGRGQLPATRSQSDICADEKRRSSLDGREANRVGRLLLQERNTR